MENDMLGNHIKIPREVWDDLEMKYKVENGIFPSYPLTSYSFLIIDYSGDEPRVVFDSKIKY